ncbi:excisionase family DNA binding protein [Tunturiibacter psychrotolerans]
MEPKFCTVAQALNRVSIGQSYLYERFADGSIRSVKAGRRRLVDVASLDAWASSLPESPLKSTAEAKKGL